MSRKPAPPRDESPEARAQRARSRKWALVTVLAAFACLIYGIAKMILTRRYL